MRAPAVLFMLAGLGWSQFAGPACPFGTAHAGPLDVDAQPAVPFHHDPHGQLPADDTGGHEPSGAPDSVCGAVMVCGAVAVAAGEPRLGEIPPPPPEREQEYDSAHRSTHPVHDPPPPRRPV